MTTRPNAPGERKRIIWLAGIFAAIGLILFGRIAYWQLLPHEEIVALAEALHQRPNDIPAVRGSILDATGHYLVSSTVRYTIGVSPSLLTKKQRLDLAPRLADILKISLEEADEALAYEGEYYQFGERYSFTHQQAEDIESLPEANAFSMEVRFPRLYPDDGLAAGVLGFVSMAGVAQYGLEQFYDRELSGQAGAWYNLADLASHQTMADRVGYRSARDGADLYLTLDRNIQLIAEAILREGIEQNKATTGSMIVLDPNTGAILAMAMHPSYRPGVYWDVGTSDRYVNTCVSAIYEPVPSARGSPSRPRWKHE